MASRPVSRALRQTARQLTAASAPAQKRTFVSALKAGATAAPRAAVTTQFQQTRGVKTIDFAGTKEEVYGMFELLLDTIECQDCNEQQHLTSKQSVPTGQRRSFLNTSRTTPSPSSAMAPRVTARVSTCATTASTSLSVYGRAVPHGRRPSRTAGCPARTCSTLTRPLARPRLS
jgi:hypothetical protein